MTATDDAAFVREEPKVPYAADGGEVAWQMDTTVAETANEAVEVAADTGLEASPTASKPRTSANNDEHFMDSFFAPPALESTVCARDFGQPQEASLAISAIPRSNSIAL